MKNRIAKLSGMKEHLTRNVLGQSVVIDALTSHCHRAELNLTSAKQPKGSFLFLGPPGVGKTELAIVFSDYLREGGTRYARFDMADFMHFDSVKEFRGDNNRKGRLAEALDTMKEGGVLLFDEVEKASPDLMKLFLGILSYAKVTVGNGTSYDLSKYYCVFTSNIGSAQLKEIASLPESSVRAFILKEIEKTFSPEWLDRIDEVLIFKQLSHDVQRGIVELHLKRKVEELNSRGNFSLTYDQQVLEYIIREGISPDSGARSLKKCIARNVEGALAKKIMSDEVTTVHGSITLVDGRVVVDG